MSTLDDLIRAVIIQPTGAEYFNCNNMHLSTEDAFYDIIVDDEALNFYIDTGDVYLVDEEGNYITDEEGNYIIL